MKTLPIFARLPKRCGPHQVSDWLGRKLYLSHSIRVWYILLHLVDFHGRKVGNYTSPMDP